jgi:hypothetical protein
MPNRTADASIFSTYPGYYMDRKLFACVIGDAVAI